MGRWILVVVGVALLALSLRGCGEGDAVHEDGKRLLSEHVQQPTGTQAPSNVPANDWEAASSPKQSGEQAQTPQAPLPAVDQNQASGTAPLTTKADSASAEILARCEAVAKGTAGALAEALQLLPELKGQDQEKLGAAVRDAAGNVRDSNSLLALLGTNNAFLHSEEGRRIAERVRAVATREPADQATITLSRLAGLAMRGAISLGEREARAAVEDLRRDLMATVQHTVLNPAYVSRARTFEVGKGDALTIIAARIRREGIKVEAGTLAMLNRISDPTRIRPGQVIKAPVDPIMTVVEKHSYLMAVCVGDIIVRLYWVAHGKDNCTPETTFTIGEKKEKPDWYMDGRVVPYGHPDNVLGDYFVKFEHKSFTGFGAHGTSDPASVGTMASKGCIRMYDEDIKEYFSIIPRGTQVEIRASR